MIVRSALIHVMLRAAERASVLLRRDFSELENLQTTKKGVSDFVSSTDLRCEEKLIRELSRARPDYGVLSEESAERPSKGGCSRRFVIDPLDGTLNFIHGCGHVSISIAVEDKLTGVVAGVVYDPLRFEGFWAERDVGSFLNFGGKDTRLRTSVREVLDDSVYATVLSFNKGVRDDAARDRFVSSFSRAVDACCGVRISGSAALDLAYVAAGRWEGFWGEGLRLWDCAAGLLLAELAGGSVGLLARQTGKQTGRDVWLGCREGLLVTANETQTANFRKKVWQEGKKEGTQESKKEGKKERKDENPL